MDAIRYEVSASRLVKNQIRASLSTARHRGKLDSAIRAAEWIMEELARTPFELGESRHFLESMKLQVRIAFVGPIAVDFAVHEESRKVFVLGFRWNDRSS